MASHMNLRSRTLPPPIVATRAPTTQTSLPLESVSQLSSDRSSPLIPGPIHNIGVQTIPVEVITLPTMTRPYSRFDYDRDAATVYAIDSAMALGDYPELQNILTLEVAFAARECMPIVAHKERTERLTVAEASLASRASSSTASVERFQKFIDRFVAGPTRLSPRPSPSRG